MGDIKEICEVLVGRLRKGRDQVPHFALQVPQRFRDGRDSILQAPQHLRRTQKSRRVEVPSNAARRFAGMGLS